MWTEIVFEDATAMQAVDMVRALSQAGLVMNQDFIWRYQPKGTVVGADEHGYILSGRGVTIGFRDPAMATFYSLKWQG